MMSQLNLPDPEIEYEISVSKVASLAGPIADGEVQLIDCREPDEWDINHLPSAVLVPLSRFAELADVVISASRPAVVYCHHGVRSVRAVLMLRSRGLVQSWSMAGGIDAWSDKIDPTLPKY